MHGTINQLTGLLTRPGPAGGGRSGLPPGPKGRLFRKYAALLIALVGSALLVNAALGAYYAYREHRDALVAVQREKAQGAAAVIEQFVKEIEGQLGWTTHAGVLSGPGGMEQRRFDFLRLLRQAPAITDLTFIDADGREQLKVSRLSMDVIGSGTNRADEVAVKDAREKRRYVGPVYFRKESEPYMTLAVAGQGRNAGVTIAEVNLKLIWDVISRIRAGKAGTAYAVDDRGLLIAHPDIGLVLRKTDLSALPQVVAARSATPAARADVSFPSLARDRLGNDVLTAQATVDSLRWHVFVEQPLREAYQPIYDSLWRTGLFVLSALGLASLAGLWMAQRMVVPIQALTAGAARIGSGDLDHRIEIKTGDELEALATGFNAMGGQLKAHYAGLERTVEERTRELQESLTQQTATADVLKSISRSAFDLQMVLDTLIAAAVPLAGADMGVLRRRQGDAYVLAATHGIKPEWRDLFERNPNTAGRGIAVTRAALEGRTIEIPDVLADPEWVAPESQKVVGFRALLATPLIREGKQIGILSFIRFAPGPFSKKQIELVETFADQAVIAIENARLFEAEKTRTKELKDSLEYQTAISNVLQAISTTPGTLSPVYDSMLTNALECCHATLGMLFERHGDVFHVVAHRGYPSEVVEMIDRTPAYCADECGLHYLVESRLASQIEDMRAQKFYKKGHPLTVAAVERIGARTALGVPLIKDDEVAGAFVFLRLEKRLFSQREIDLVTNFAQQAVIAMENARLLDELQARQRELQESLEYQTATSEVLGVISRSPSQLQPVLDTIVNTAALLCQAEHAFIWKLDGGVIHLAAINEVDESFAKFEMEHPHSPTRGTVAGRSVLERQTIHIPDVLKDPEYDWHEGQKIGKYRTLLGVPLLREGMPFGTIVLTRSTVRPFADKEIELVTTFADQAVIAIENARLFEEVQARTRDLSRSVAELKALGEVGKTVSSTLDLTKVLHTILENACTMSYTSGGALYVFDKTAGAFHLEAGHNMSEEHIARVRAHPIRLGENVVGESAERREAAQIEDLETAPSSPMLDILRRDGVRAALSVPLLHQGDVIGALVVRRNRPGAFSQETVRLLEAFAAQSAIAIHNARLFKEIEDKGEQLRIASQHKSQFLANMSHELRTPLNAILGYTELMQDNIYGTLPEKAAGVLGRVQSNGKHLLGLINSVLDLSKIEAGQLELDIGEFSLGSVIETVMVATESLATEKKLRLLSDVAEDLPRGLGDERRIAQVLLNLVGNAIKFTDRGEVRVTAKINGKRFRISVYDTGPGIPAAEHDRIFEEFHQVDSSNTKAKGGTGLGLSIAKRIVEMHGGRIWVDSAPGKGATFHVELPLRFKSIEVTHEPAHTRH